MVLHVHQLEKKYKNKLILENINFSIGGGEIIGLVGPNGAGKSTLMRSVLGLEEINGGSVQINNISHNSPEFFKYISFLPSDNYLYMQLTGYDHLSFIANVYKIPPNDIEDIIDLVGIRSYVNQPVKSYSYGMRQHLFIAVSILTKPLIILMDEPFNGLDPTSTIELKQLIRTLHGQGISIVISTHNLDILEDLTDTIWFIKEGKLHTNQLESKIDVPYEIKCNPNHDLAQLMQDSELPFQINENRLITDAAHSIEIYLQWLLKQDIQIQSVNPLKRNLEELYRDFYDV
ncbi:MULTISPECIES: ABC transporter ATP-binding protein [Solibacillus]|uniref:ABC transporter ATP-binding protein n=1 Tax=Solibacillus merdavium TaxID=2762218 RepID=A0ABR8XKT3_9BACL|nr:ABC transporter ATP-binding protein [Solibacillus merdavium]MBD8032516.1 ABC transporter ATP-binding protein [Solibacillus merdavium]